MTMMMMMIIIISKLHSIRNPQHSIIVLMLQSSRNFTSTSFPFISIQIESSFSKINISVLTCCGLAPTHDGCPLALK